MNEQCEHHMIDITQQHHARHHYFCMKCGEEAVGEPIRTMFAQNATLDPRVRVLESHQEVIGDEVVIVIDRFEIVEVSIIP